VVDGGPVTARGHAPSSVLVRAGDLTRRSAYLLRRARWCGRGWPLEVYLADGVAVSGSGCVELGRQVRLGSRTWLHAEEDGRLSIGERTAIGRDSLLTAAGRVVVGDDVLFGPNVLVTDNGHGRRSSPEPYLHQPVVTNGPITIGSGVWIGMGASVISGRSPLHVGDHAIVGAGAVVRGDVAAGTVVPPGTVHVG
jgi:acetyltransferase-like isoleucine patch superfamily enzyme